MPFHLIHIQLELPGLTTKGVSQKKNKRVQVFAVSMGLDGGTYITRSDVLRGQSWRLSQADGSHSTRGGCVSSSQVYQGEQAGRKTTRLIEWTTCSLSGEPLQDNSIKADFLGNLYDKEAVLEFLLGKSGVFVDDESKHRFLNISSRAEGQFDHLKRPSDVFDVKGAREKQGESAERTFTCPVTDLSPLRCPFSALVKCGHMMSDRGVRLATDQICPACNSAFALQDVITINGSQQQVEHLRLLLPSRKTSGRRKRKCVNTCEGDASKSPIRKQRKSRNGTDMDTKADKLT